jgi:hypothetical protein
MQINLNPSPYSCQWCKKSECLPTTEQGFRQDLNYGTIFGIDGDLRVWDMRAKSSEEAFPGLST